VVVEAVVQVVLVLLALVIKAEQVVLVRHLQLLDLL
jgi:hypothetical protein